MSDEPLTHGFDDPTLDGVEGGPIPWGRQAWGADHADPQRPAAGNYEGMGDDPS